MITLPDVRQTRDYDCGAAAVNCVLAHFGQRTRGPVALANVVQGMAPDTVEAYFHSVGLPVVKGNMQLSDLKHFTATGRPVLCPITMPDGEGHWVVVRGVVRGKVFFQDPAAGPRDLRASGPRSFEAAWESWSASGFAYKCWGIAVGSAD